MSREELPDILETKNIAPRGEVRVGDGKHGLNSRAEQLILSWLKQAVWELALVSTAMHLSSSSSAFPGGILFFFSFPERKIM